MSTAPTPLVPGGHAVYRLAHDLLLVFKPAGHREASHAHPYGQRLRVLGGRLLLRRDGREIVLGPDDQAACVPAGETHETVAMVDTWLAVDRPAS